MTSAVLDAKRTEQWPFVLPYAKADCAVCSSDNQWGARQLPDADPYLADRCWSYHPHELVDAPWGGEQVDIDVDLEWLVRRVWAVGAVTTHSCAGGGWEPRYRSLPDLAPVANTDGYISWLQSTASIDAVLRVLPFRSHDIRVDVEDSWPPDRFTVRFPALGAIGEPVARVTDGGLE